MSEVIMPIINGPDGFDEWYAIFLADIESRGMYERVDTKIHALLQYWKRGLRPHDAAQEDYAWQ